MFNHEISFLANSGFLSKAASHSGKHAKVCRPTAICFIPIPYTRLARGWPLALTIMLPSFDLTLLEVPSLITLKSL